MYLKPSQRNALQNGYFTRPVWKFMLAVLKHAEEHSQRLGCKDDASGNNKYIATEIEDLCNTLGISVQYIDCLNHQTMLGAPLPPPPLDPCEVGLHLCFVFRHISYKNDYTLI